MTLSAATVILDARGPRLLAGRPLPVEALVLGRPVAEAAELLPRLFNLCRVAQGTAARLSLGLPGMGDPAAEIVRDHVARLCILLPRAFGLPPVPIPHEPLALLGPSGLPTGGDLSRRGGPLAALVRAVKDGFPPGMATTEPLPPPGDPLAEGAFENSAAGRQSDHPLLCSVERSHGRGPLWRLAGLMADLEAALGGRLPPAQVTDGIATVAAARGSYALRLTQAAGLVTGITRRTPTDHMLAPGGALLQSLASLPPARRGLAPQVVALHDPCIPVTVREAETCTR